MSKKIQMNLVYRDRGLAKLQELESELMQTTMRLSEYFREEDKDERNFFVQQEVIIRDKIKLLCDIFDF